MNPLVSSMVAGDLATTWHRIVAMAIVTIIIQKGEVATDTDLGELTDLRHLLARFRLFHRSRVLVAPDHVEVQPD